MKKLHTWDELSCEIQVYITMEDIFQLWEASREGGWETSGWEPDELGFASDVRIVTTGNHIGLECWAEDSNEADEKFSRNKTYREYYEQYHESENEHNTNEG